ncbi:MAG: hypothetical protein AAF705_11550, partial [Bacteroidota bacterium]
MMKNLILPLCILFALPIVGNINYPRLNQRRINLEANIAFKATRYLGFNWVEGEYKLEQSFLEIDADNQDLYFPYGNLRTTSTLNFFGEEFRNVSTLNLLIEQKSATKLIYSS